MENPRASHVPAVPARTGLTLNAKFALGVGTLLVVVSLVYSGLAYFAMRRSAFAMTQTRLGLVADQFTQLLGAASVRLTTTVQLATRNSALGEFLAAPSERTRARALAVLRSATDSNPLRIGVQLWKIGTGRTPPSLVLADGHAPADQDRGSLNRLAAVAATLGAPVISSFTAERDSLHFPIVASVAGIAGGRPAGFVVVWRHLAAAPGSRDALHAMLGRETGIYVGSRNGPGWTDLEHVVAPPLATFDSIAPLMSYKRAGVGDVYATPRLVPGTPWIVVVEQKASTVLSEVHRLTSRTAVAGVAILALALLVTGILSRRLTIPIRRLTDAAARVSAGDYSATSNTRYTSDELGALALSFDTMVTRVRDSMAAHHEAERRAHQSQKMEAVGQLASGLAHDFNNLLTIIISYADFLATDVSERHRTDLQAIRSAADSASQLTRQLLIFSRQRVVQARTADIGEIVAGTGTLLKPVLGDNIELVTPTGGESWANVDAGQLEQIIINLAVNARDAMPDGGRLTIETKNVEFFGTDADLPPPFPPGRYVNVVVTDTGVGMNQETAARVFEPFFTTKDPGKGTGLGLATVYGIVTQSGGYVSVYSEPGKGTTFKMYFPRVEADDQARATTAAAPVPRGDETVFVVEDQPAVRGVVRQVLERQGYRVLEAPNGHVALDVAEKMALTINLLITDMMMPQMGGRQLADRLSEAQPRIKVLFISGFTDDTVLRQGALASGVEYLEKPFGPDALARKVRQVLDSPHNYRDSRSTKTERVLAAV